MRNMNEKKNWGLKVMVSNPFIEEPSEFTKRFDTKKQAMDMMNSLCDNTVSGKIDIGENEITGVEKLTRYCTLIYTKLMFTIELSVCKV